MRNFNVTDEGVRHFVEGIDWSPFTTNNDPNYMIDYLYDSILYPFLNEICPAKTIISRNKPVPWINSEIKELMNRRDEM